jgi:oligopeptide/dipeptide ABC transporter ATP-binding protein
MNNPILKINNLKVVYKDSKIGSERIINAVNGVDLEINEGEIYSIAGESGCGKSTLAKAIMRLVKVKSGEIFFQGENVLDFSSDKQKTYRKNVQMIFQNPYSSLNPKMKIKDILMETLDINTEFNKTKKLELVSEIIEKVGLGQNSLELYPHEFSGGQRQRIAIARALILKPKLVIADEPVSALDASIQAQIINLLNDLKKELNLTILFISHDLSVIKYLSDRVSVMYWGQILEQGLTDEIYSNPSHPYTKALLNAVPQFGKQPTEMLQGDLPIELPAGCKFFSRCKYSHNECDLKCPTFVNLSDTHKVRCTL